MSELEQFQVSGNAAKHYERYIVPTIFVPWATDLVERAVPPDSKSKGVTRFRPRRILMENYVDARRVGYFRAKRYRGRRSPIRERVDADAE